MLFQSQSYVLAFLPVAAALYYAVAGSLAWRQRVLVAASLVFYGWWDVRFIPLLIGQIAATWILAWLDGRSRQRILLVVGIVLNLASLATFKYLDFALASVEAVTGTALPRAQLALPIGISFFSFQLISYLIDRLRGEAPLYRFGSFALFVMLFPHLIAGPIVRHNELVPQFADDPRRDGMWERVAVGLIVFTVGFGKKVLLADRLAPHVDPLFGEAATRSLDFAEAWSTVLGFSLQLFLDFSAYSEMAIGSALVFGLTLPENFRRPYLATNLREFWRRWHMSLSAFLRDYVYVPLGGSQHGPLRYVGATLATLAICGLWHGAGWTFVAWGLWHGAGLIVCRAWQQLRRPLPPPIGWLATMAFVLIGWVIFRAGSFHTAGSVLASLAGLAGWHGTFGQVGLLAAAGLTAALVPSAHEIRNGLLEPRPAIAAAAAALAVFCLLEVGRGTPQAFIYFRF
jgi:D-alanyl-lipoteichoic acid acyltransferase DltB (MBOAT superfamily)